MNLQSNPGMPRVRGLRVLLVATLLAGCGGGGGGDGGSSGGNPSPPQPPGDAQFRASGASPFAAGCDGVPAAGTLYVNTEVEPMVAVNPRNTQNLVGVWQQDRWSTGGARGLLTGVSLDGGQTWATRLPPFSRCAGGNAANNGDYARATDPWVSFGPGGVAYQIAQSFTGETFAAGSSNAVLVSRSTDGGQSWSTPAVLVRDGAQAFNDKDAITADPTDARYVYAVWDRLDSDTHAASYLARTVDGGATWEPARPFYDPGPGRQTINNQVLVLPNGTLVNFFTQLDTTPNQPANAQLSLVRSNDKGATWSSPIVLSSGLAIGARDPETNRTIRDAANLGSFAVGPRGELVAVWQDARFSNGQRDGIAFSRSTDGGLSWMTPVQINAVTSTQAFVPSVTVRGDGTIGVTYYDLRNNTADPAGLPTDIWLTRSSDGVTWRETHVSGPFDLAVAPIAGGLFVGDYQALVSIGNVFVPFYVQTSNGNLDNRSDVFATLATSATAATAGAGVAATAAEAVVRAQPATAIGMTPEHRQKVNDSVLRIVTRRLGREPRAP